MDRPVDLTAPGHFVVGANYWASHAGTNMWTDWRPEVVEEDFRRLSQAGLQVLRVFPLWPVFQPLTQLWGGGGQPVEIRHGEDPLPDTPVGQAGMSEEALQHFEQFCDLAEKYGLKLLVGLLTGWMSGRLHVPPALEGHDVLTDPLAIEWELRFVRCFVERLRSRPAIVGWDLGNECNCMGQANRRQAFVWTATIANAIRAQDATRPVVSGLHGLSPDGPWSVFDQAELTDLLTTHPYPVFTPHCDQDPVNRLRTIAHSTAESRYYADLGGKPCLCQEIGTLGPVIASERIAADFIRSCLLSLWAHDCHGLIWWCAHEQDHLTHAPYDWHAVERELGLLRADGSAKPVLGELTAFRRFLDDLPFAALPQRRRQAVCLLTEGQDQWGVAYSSFILARQAGFDIEFQYATQPLREAELYLMPCLSGHAMIPLHRLQALQERVAAGATLYLSLDSGLPSGFEPLTGLEPQTRERRRAPGLGTFDLAGESFQWPIASTFKVRCQPTRASVLGVEDDQTPLFSRAPYGQGQVFFLNLPLEMNLTQQPGAFDDADGGAWWRIYRAVAATQIAAQRTVTKQHPLLGLTEHPLSDQEEVIIGVNYSPGVIEDTLCVKEGWSLGSVWRGEVTSAPEGLQVRVAGNEALVFSLTRS